MKEIICLIFIYAGVILMMIASLGLFRLPDAYTRMSAVTKAITLKVALLMIGSAIYFDDFFITMKAITVIVFIAITAPVSSHLMAREGYLSGLKLWKGTVRDDYKEHLMKQQKATKTSDDPENENQQKNP